MSAYASVFFALLSFAASAFAGTEEERKFLLLYFTEEELVVESPTRSPKPISQVAENVTVVTARDIRLMNAHTLADVLNTVTGVQVFSTSLGAPGASALAFIEGSDNRHVTVLIDGIIMNNLSNNAADLGMIPVQNIDRVEIIKGPASSAWGSSLGGVVNVITKSGNGGAGISGVFSASYGTKDTGDFRAETSGKKDKLGYYLDAGRLQTDGLTHGFDASDNNVYMKLSYDVADRAAVTFSLGYVDGTRGGGEDPVSDTSLSDVFRNLRSTIAFNAALSREIELNVSYRQSSLVDDFRTDQLSTGLRLVDGRFVDEGSGASAKLTWKAGPHSVVLGSDYDARTLDSDAIAGGAHALRKAAYFVNDTFSAGSFSVTPGVRYDRTNTNGDTTSPSLGMTYSISDTTLLRAYAADGFSIPPLAFTFGDNQFVLPNPGLKMEKVASYQLGAETGALKYAWIKLTLFRNEIRDAIVPQFASFPFAQAVNKGRQRREGAEFEVKTTPLFHMTLSAGVVYISAKDLDTEMRIPDIPQYTYDVSLLYDNEQVFTALLRGRYVNWNSQSDFQGIYGAYVFDLNISKPLIKRKTQSLEIFLEGHNLFNGKQYAISIYRNPGRWYEAGLRYAF